MDQITPTQKRAFDLYTKTISLVSSQKEIMIDLIEVLKEIKEKKLYRYLGEGGFDTWSQFLAAPEIDLAKPTVDAYIDIYEYYIGTLKIKREELFKISLNRLNILKGKIKKIESKSEQLELIEQAKNLSYSDFYTVMREKKLVEEPAFHITKCEKCNKYEIEYHQDKICICKGTTAIYAKPLEIES